MAQCPTNGHGGSPPQQPPMHRPWGGTIGDVRVQSSETSWAVLDNHGHLIKEYSHQPFKRQDPASTTKLWTLYTIASMEDRGALPKDFLKKHKRDLDVMMVCSDNPVSDRLAIAASGSVVKFTAEMNALAIKMGLRDTRFNSPAGMLQEGNYSNAHDMARMSFLADRDFPELLKSSGTVNTYVGKNTGWRVLNEGVDFGKTGTGTGVYGARGSASYTGGAGNGYFSIAGARDGDERVALAEEIVKALYQTPWTLHRQYEVETVGAVSSPPATPKSPKIPVGKRP